MNESDFSFDGQRADEEVILYRHQHPWILAKMGFVDVALALIVLVFFLIVGASALSIGILVVTLVLGLAYTFNKLYLFKNVFCVLTDQRIINIDQSSVFGRKVQETELVNIYNISYTTKGIMKSFFNFGEVELTTQGDVNDRIILKNIPTPHEVFEKISKARNTAMGKLSKTERTILR